MPSPLVVQLQSLRRNLHSREVPPFSTSALTEAVELLGDGPVAPPPPNDRLAKLFENISAQLSAGVPLVELGKSAWLDAPWLAFWRWNERALVEVGAFHDGLSVAAGASATVGRRCIHVFLRDYDPFALSASVALDQIILAVLRSGETTLTAWVERNQKFRIFARDGGPLTTLAGLLAQRLPSLPKPLTDCLGEAGLSGLLAHGGYSFGMLLAWCARAHERPWEKQDVIEAWMQMCSGPLAGREYRVVEALLARWRNDDPEAEWRKPLLAWLQKRHGDPRDAVSGVWPEVDAELRAVAVRWLTLQTIEGFFEVLDDYASRRGDDAMQRQWPYRKAFWLAYYRRGVVLDAKVAVGRDMEECLDWRALQGRFGNRVARLEAPDLRLSALLLRLRGLVVFVGTHNASCRIWDETSPAAPKLRCTKFRYAEIVTTPRSDLQINPMVNDTGIVQAGAENGTWQRKLRDFLRRKIGITIPDNELMP